MDERLAQRLNEKLQQKSLFTTQNVDEMSGVVPNNDYAYLQDEYIPRQRNFSVLEEVVGDTSKLALVILFGISLYALYVLGKNKN